MKIMGGSRLSLPPSVAPVYFHDKPRSRVYERGIIRLKDREGGL